MKNQFYIAVCDDEQADLNEIAEMTREICREEQVSAAISCFGSAKELLDEVQNGRKYHLLLIDVLMPELDGMELARVLRRQEEKASIVFISCNREMALQGYEVNAVRYLAKPLKKRKLKEAVSFCYEKLKKNRELLLPVDGSMRKVSPKDIYYVEIDGRKSKIRMEKEEWNASCSITEMEELLEGQGFVRCHQSFLVNCRCVRTFRTSFMELTDGRRIPVSKHRVKEVRQIFFDYLNH